ncbi:MAG: hypothetical protein Q7J44_06170, partial [Pseudotabrizicola sp.]
MLDDTLKAQLQAYLERLQQPIELVASLDGSSASLEMRELLETIAALSSKIALRTDGQDARVPSFTVQGQGQPGNLRFAAVPLGHEFTSLVLALLWAGGHPPNVEAGLIEQIKALPGDYRIEI